MPRLTKNTIPNVAADARSPRKLASSHGHEFSSSMILTMIRTAIPAPIAARASGVPGRRVYRPTTTGMKRHTAIKE